MRRVHISLLSIFLVGCALLICYFVFVRMESSHGDSATVDSGSDSQKAEGTSAGGEAKNVTPGKSLVWPSQLVEYKVKIDNGVSVSASVVKIGETLIPEVTIVNIQKLMECDDNTLGTGINFNFRRETGVLQAIMWDGKARFAIRISPGLNSVFRGPPPSEVNMPFFLESSEQPRATRFKSDFIAQIAKADGNLLLVIKSGSLVKKVPWHEEGKLLGAPFFFLDYPVAVCLKIHGAFKQAESILLFERDRAELLGEIRLPNVDVNSAPTFILDPETDSLVCIDMKLKWVYMADISGLIGAKKSNSNKSWPHYDGVHGWRGNAE